MTQKKIKRIMWKINQRKRPKGVKRNRYNGLLNCNLKKQDYLESLFQKIQDERERNETNNKDT